MIVDLTSAVALAAAHVLSSGGPAQVAATAQQKPTDPAASAAQAGSAGSPTNAQAVADTSPAQSDPCCKLAALTPVELEIISPASSKTSLQGEKIQIRVAEPVTVDGHVLVPAGTEGFAEVIQVSHGGFGGKSGELVIGAPYLTLSGQRIALKRFRYGPASGKDRVGQAVVATAVVGLVGMLVSGGNIDIPKGTRANAVVTSDILVPAVAPAAVAESNSTTGKE